MMSSVVKFSSVMVLALSVGLPAQFASAKEPPGFARPEVRTREAVKDGRPVDLKDAGGRGSEAGKDGRAREIQQRTRMGVGEVGQVPQALGTRSAGDIGSKLDAAAAPSSRRTGGKLKAQLGAAAASLAILAAPMSRVEAATGSVMPPKAETAIERAIFTEIEGRVAAKEMTPQQAEMAKLGAKQASQSVVDSCGNFNGTQFSNLMDILGTAEKVRVSMQGRPEAEVNAEVLKAVVARHRDLVGSKEMMGEDGIPLVVDSENIVCAVAVGTPTYHEGSEAACKLSGANSPITRACNAAKLPTTAVIKAIASGA